MPPLNDPALKPENYRYLRQLIHDGCGIVLGDDKHYLLEARLQPLARRCGVSTIDDLCQLLRAASGSALRAETVELMTINETYFLRDEAQYEAIRLNLLPRLLVERPPGDRWRFWSAACSTGQEAYSLAMLLCEAGVPPGRWEILGVDLSRTVVDKANAGEYSAAEVNRGVPPAWQNRYFVSTSNGQLRVTDDIRRSVRFLQGDLRTIGSQAGTFDAVFCRNVLVYFDAPTRRGIFETIHRALRPGGWLLLGSAESGFEASDLFTRQPHPGTVILTAQS